MQIKRCSKLMSATAALGLALSASQATAATVAKFIEYVQTDGNGSNSGEYVLLDYKPTANSVVEAEVYLNNVTQTHGIFCSRGNQTNERTFTLFYVKDYGLRWDYNTTAGGTDNGLAANTKATIRCTPDGLWLNGVKSSTISVSPQSYTPANKMMLFASYTCQPTATPAATGNYANMRLYSFKAWDDNGATLRVDLLPCVDTDGKIALYDAVTGTLYYNKKSGKNFTAGPDVTFDALKVTGSPAGYGESIPAYGTTVKGLLPQAEVPVSTTPVWTNGNATVRAICTGWKLYDARGNVVSNGTEASFTYVHPTPAAYRRLEWQYRLEQLDKCAVSIGDVAPCYTNVSVSLSCAAPADDLGGGFYRQGAQLTLSIVDPDGHFTDWYGVLPAGIDATVTSVTWTATSNAEIYPRLDGWVFPDRAADISSWYVDFASGSNQNDGRAWSTPVADFSNVLARARADYVSTQRKQYVFVPDKAGVTQTVPRTYTIATGSQTTCLFTLDFPCVIQGAGRRESVVLGLSNYPYPTESVSYKAGLFKIAHAEAAMRNLTLTGYKRGKYQYPLRITAGTLDNCVFGPNLIGSYDEMLSPLVVEGGVVTNCLVTGNDCYTYSARYMYSSGIYISGSGVVTHTVVHGNVCSGGAYGGGVYMAGGTLRNSLVYNNEAARNASGVYANPTTACLIENCTIAGNRMKSGTTYAVYGLRADGSSATKKTTVRNTIVYGNTIPAGVATNLYRNSATYVELFNNLSTESFNDSATTAGNIVADPRFYNAESADFRTRISPVVDAGQVQDWMATGTDLAGDLRIRDAGVDIGAYEYVPRLTIASSLGEYGSPSPAYGVLHVPAGTSLDVSCPPVWTNAAATHIATCQGWKLFSDPDGTLLASGEGAAFTHVQPAVTDCRLEWQWQYVRTTCKVTVSDVAPCYTNVSVTLSCADPADDLGGDLYSLGAQLTLSITDPDGRFSDWYGVLPEGVDATSRTISWTADSDCAISPRLDGWVFPDRAADITSWYVDFANGSNANDGHSWATPVADFSNVLARARADYTATQRKQYVFVPDKGGATQTIPKTYNLSTTDQTICYFTLNFPVVIQGASRRENVRLSFARYPSSTGSLKAGIFKIAHAEAAMRNLTLTGMTACKYTYPLRITAGTFDNCIFTKNTNGDYDMLNGSIVLSGSGLVTNCLVTDNTMRTTTYAAYTSGIYMDGGLVTHSTICSNKCANKTLGGGVYMTGGTLRNSLVYANEAIQNASGVYTVPAANCLIENCTIADNMTKSGTSYTVYGLNATGSAVAKKTIVRNTIVYGNSGNTPDSVNSMNLYRNSATYVELYNNLSTTAFEDSATTSGNVIGDPRFTDAAARDYTIEFSAAVDAGQPQDWMATGTDLACGPRIRGAGVDIGAYEYIPSAELDASCTVSTLLPASGATTRLAATATGGTAPYSYRWLVNGVVIAEGADKAVYDYVFPGGNNSVSLVVTDAASDSVVREAPGVITVYVPETYVATDGSDTEPYDTPAKAARNVNDAFNLTAAGGTMHVLPGDYTLGAQLKYSRANVAVRSTEGPERTIFTVAPAVAAVNLATSGAVFDGITLQGFSATAIACMSNGALVTNCVIRRGSGMAVDFGAYGTLVDCVIEGVTNSSQVLYAETGRSGSGSVLLNRCRITDNRSTTTYVFYFRNQGFTLRNCLFARNYADKAEPIRLHTSQITGSRIFESCTFADNVGTAWMWVENNNSSRSITFRNNVWAGNKTTGGAVMAIGAGGWLIANNCVVDARNDTTGTWTNITTTDDPGLKRDYSPRSDSPCIDKGLHQSWMDTALDLSGNPRILHKAVDIGAFEYRQTGTILSLR